MALLPMTQAGAMAEDIEYLQKALVVFLPDDNHGRAVFGLDRIRCNASIAPRNSMLRCWFYMLHVLSEREDTQKRGYIMIINCRVSE